MMRTRREGLTVTMTFIGLVFAATCATNPASGKNELALVSESSGIAMGRQGAADVTATIGLIPMSACRHTCGASVRSRLANRAPHAFVGSPHRR
jgi:hypothetical protein